jgi:hypothetical protein
MQKIKKMANLLCLTFCISMVLTTSILVRGQGYANAENQFTIDTRANTQKAKGPIQFKLIASANGYTKTIITGLISDPNTGTINIPIKFKKDNDIVTAGYHDEYFVCGYVLNSKTGTATSYQCNEGDLQDANGINAVILDSFRPVTKNGQTTGAKDVKINVLVPLSDRPVVHLLKIVTMVKGEFQSKVINVENVNGKTISTMFTFDRDTDIGQIQEGDLYFACVSANELNPPEGTECEFHKIKSINEPNVLSAR